MDEMPVPFAPVWVLCWLIGGIGAAVVEFIRPRGVVGLMHLAMAGGFGAVAGQVIATFSGQSRLMIGELHIAEVVIGTLVTILVARRMGP